MNKKSKTLEQKVDTIIKNVDTLSHNLNTLTKTVDTLSHNLNTLTKTVDTLSHNLNTLTKTVDNLAISVAKGFDRIDVKLEDIEYRLGKIEANHERRLDVLEDRMQIIKTYFEKNPKLKVKF